MWNTPGLMLLVRFFFPSFLFMLHYFCSSLLYVLPLLPTVISHTCEITSVMEINQKDEHGDDGTILPPKDAPVDGADFSVAQKLRFHMTHELEEHILGALSEAQVFFLSFFSFLSFSLTSFSLIGCR